MGGPTVGGALKSKLKIELESEEIRFALRSRRIVPIRGIRIISRSPSRVTVHVPNVDR